MSETLVVKTGMISSSCAAAVEAIKTNVQTGGVVLPVEFVNKYSLPGTDRGPKLLLNQNIACSPLDRRLGWVGELGALTAQNVSTSFLREKRKGKKRIYSLPATSV